MERLYNLILTIENDDSIEYSEYLSQDIEIVNMISHLADDLLITHDGLCDWLNILWLEEHGIIVFPIERDGFSWLVGGIPTRKGIIAYG